MTQLHYHEITDRIQSIMSTPQQAAEVFGSRLKMAYLPGEEGLFCFASRTESWMCNPGGTVHGGICAALVDEAMGIVVYALGTGQQIAPTISLQINYHRPLLPGEDIIVRVRPVSVTRRLLTMAAEIVCAEKPESPCCSCTATFFRKDA